MMQLVEYAQLKPVFRNVNMRMASLMKHRCSQQLLGANVECSLSKGGFPCLKETWWFILAFRTLTKNAAVEMKGFLVVWELVFFHFTFSWVVLSSAVGLWSPGHRQCGRHIKWKTQRNVSCWFCCKWKLLLECGRSCCSLPAVPFIISANLR